MKPLPVLPAVKAAGLSTCPDYIGGTSARSPLLPPPPLAALMLSTCLKYTCPENAKKKKVLPAAVAARAPNSSKSSGCSGTKNANPLLAPKFANNPRKNVEKPVQVVLVVVPLHAVTEGKLATFLGVTRKLMNAKTSRVPEPLVQR